MAGNYPDAPSWRMAFDKDGTQMVLVDMSAGGVTQLTAAAVTGANTEHPSQASFLAYSGSSKSWAVVFLFPELRDVDGYWLKATGYAWSVQTSTDTTNGQDGTWATLGSFTGQSVSQPNYRTSIASSTVLAVRAIRYVSPSSTAAVMTQVHLYGEPAPGQNPNRLELWHPTLDEKLPPAYFDWGDVPRTSSADRLFRVKNLSAVQTAGATRVAMDVLSDTTPSVPAQHTLSHGGGSFLAQVTIGDLAPGAISGPVTIRRITPTDAIFGLWAFRVFAESTAWS